MNTFNSSPGVYTVERDLSASAVQKSSTIGVVVGEMDRGPVNQRTLITSEAEYLATFGNPDPTIGWAAHCALAFLEQANQLYVTRVAPEALYGGCVIYWDGRFNKSRIYDQGVSDPTTYPLGQNDLFTIYASDPGNWNNDMFVRLYPDTKSADAFFYIEVYQSGDALPLEKWRCHLDYVTDGFGRQANVESYVNANSKYIKIAQNHQAQELVANPNKQLINSFDAGTNSSVPGIQLLGGANGRRPTTGELMLAWELYQDREVLRVTILMDSGYCNPDIQTKIDEICKSRMDCVGIFSVPQDSQSAQRAVAYRRNDLHLDSSYSALYGSWLIVADKYTDVTLEMPPTGHVAACYARTDRDFDTWWAPAGMTRGALSVAGVSQIYDQGMRNVLYDSQINAIRLIDGAGIKIFGADTLQVLYSSLSNMSVRRLLITIETTLEDAFLGSVFDPNNVILRSRLAGTADTFLGRMVDEGALYSKGVVCDDTNNTSDTIAAGDLNIAIYCDPTLPIKRLNFNAIINRTGVRVVAV
jgi:phage tail sheath protein FI